MNPLPAASLPRRRTLLLGALAAPFARHAAADTFPARPIHVLVPYGAGGGLDLIARAVGERAGRLLKQPVIVENRTGANGVIATEAVAKAPGDGYTVVIGVPATIAINPSLYKLTFDPLKDLQPIGQLATAHFVLVTAPGSGLRTVEQLVAKAKANPGQLSFASYGNGSAPHLAGQMLRSLAGIDMVHVPYKGSMAALPDVIAGRVTVMFDVVANVQPHVAAGTLQVLAAAGDRVPPQFPQAPLVKATVPGFSLDGWVGLFAPVGTPAAIVRQLNEATRAALADPVLARRLTDMGFEVVPGTPQQMQDIARRDFATYARAVQAAGLRME